LPVAALSVAAERKNSNALLAADDKQQLLDLEQEWVTAENRHDASTLRRILQEKFVAPVPDRRNQSTRKPSSGKTSAVMSILWHLKLWEG
jgi:hypothetical protein